MLTNQNWETKFTKNKGIKIEIKHKKKNGSDACVLTQNFFHLIIKL